RLGEQTGEAGAGGDAAIHADAIAVREVVSAPGGVLVAVHVGSVVVAGPHHEPHPERGGVLLVQLPRLAQQLAQHLTSQGLRSGVSCGSQARRPSANRFAWARGCPVQNSSAPTFETATSPPGSSSVPATSCASVGAPASGSPKGKRRFSLHQGAR